MEKYAQISITLGTLGIVIALAGLFPGIIGLETIEGVGVLQVLVILLGFSILFTGAYLFAKQVFYPGMPNTLAQDIGIRLTMTGLLIAAAAGLADVLGFGSHDLTEDTPPLLGRLQAMAFVGAILLASSGVIIFAVFGPSHEQKTDATSEDDILPQAS
jgi:hypothetical protein